MKVSLWSVFESFSISVKTTVRVGILTPTASVSVANNTLISGLELPNIYQNLSDLSINVGYLETV